VSPLRIEFHEFMTGLSGERNSSSTLTFSSETEPSKMANCGAPIVGLATLAGGYRRISAHNDGPRHRNIAVTSVANARFMANQNLTALVMPNYLTCNVNTSLKQGTTEIPKEW